MKKLWSRLGVLLPCLLMATPAAFASDPGTIDTGDTAWVLISAALVFIMTPGLGFFYGGMVRNKNVLTTIMQSFFIVAMISVEWILIGYAMTFGTDINGFIGSLDKVGLAGVGMSVLENGTIPEMAFVAFQCMFAVITPALITGAFAERMKFHAFVVFILLWAIFIYNPMAHWVWGGGFLAKLGALDFAGGLVIHILSGVSGLTLCVLLGKRYGYGKIPMVPHNLPMTVLGAALLWFGWFGFNAGSALGANALAASAFIASQAAAAAATVTWVAVEWIVQGKPTILGAASGCIAGLVAITPAAGFVAPLPALIIGAIGVSSATSPSLSSKPNSVTTIPSTPSVSTASAVPGVLSLPASGLRQKSTRPVLTAYSTAAPTCSSLRSFRPLSLTLWPLSAHSSSSRSSASS